MNETMLRVRPNKDREHVQIRSKSRVRPYSLSAESANSVGTNVVVFILCKDPVQNNICRIKPNKSETMCMQC